MIPISMLAMAILASFSSNQNVDRSDAITYVSANTVGMLALPAMLPSITLLLEAIAQTTAALVVAYTAHDWTEADRLQATP